MWPASLGLLAVSLLASCGSRPTAGGSCQSTRDCVSGELCVAGTCTPAKPNLGCQDDTECEVGQWCDPTDNQCKTVVIDPDGGSDAGIGGKDAALPDTGTSTSPNDAGTNDAGGGSCTRDDECGTPPADICVANQCVAGCNEPNGLTCTGGTECDPVTGHCVSVNSSCNTDPDCMPGPPVQVCINQQCVPGCDFDPNLCGAQEICDTNTGRCVAAPMPCNDDTECNPPATVCESNQCVPGCNEAGGIQCAGATPDCDPATGRCVAAPGCQLDSECTGQNEICVNNACVVRCDQPGGMSCGADVCNPNDGRCLPGNLPLGDQTCIIDEQCATGMCLGLTISMMSLDVCTDPCGAGSQCPLDYNCVTVSGMGFCLSENLFNPPATFDTPAGGACTSMANTCQTGWCNTGTSQCIETCSRPADCASFGGNCFTYEQDNNGTPVYDNLCFEQATLSPVGTACAANADCMSGICDRYAGTCAQHCCADQDCAAAESCALYDLDANTIMKICQPRSAGAGTGALGASCTTPADCESEVCAAVDPSDTNSPRKCSTTCCQDQDCAVLPLGGACRPAGTPIMGQITGVCIPN